jgi:hypothetical protein
MAKVGKKPEGVAPKCACGCGQDVSWQRGRGWSKYVHGHHIRIKNPNTGDHCRGDKNPMRQPEVVAKMSGDSHWRHRPENAERAEEYTEEQHSQMMEINNPNWKGGQITTKEGRVFLRQDGRYVARSRVVMAEHLGRELRPEEVVHHTDGVAEDKIRSLRLHDTQASHVAFHNRCRAKLSLDPKDAPSCLCGCGQKVTESKYKKGTWNWFIPGHQHHVR